MTGAERRPVAAVAICFAATIAVLGWTALAIDIHRSVTASLLKGRSLGESLFLFFHFFTIEANVGIAVLMSVTAIQLLRRRPQAPSGLFNAALVYIVVTCVTYEIMLRSKWTPHGMQFVTDTILHDVVPLLFVIFWIAFAPRAGARWRDALLILAYPLVYFILTLTAGALGEGYPYGFINADKLGYPRVFVTALVFLAIFYALGLTATAICRHRAKKGDPTSRFTAA